MIRKQIGRTNDYVLIDECDEHLCKSLQIRGDGLVASRLHISGKQESLALHRRIMNAPIGSYVDHINGNPLDNRRENLRFCTLSQNSCNRRRPKSFHKKPLKHLYRGIAYSNTKYNLQKRWIGRIKVNGKQIGVKYFETALEAAIHYDSLAKEHHGEFARLNFFG